MQAEDNSTGNETRLEDCLPNPSYKTEWSETVKKKGLEFYLKFSLPNHRASVSELTDLLIKHQIPIDKLKSNYIKGKTNKITEYSIKISVNSYSTTESTIKVKVQMNNTSIGKALDLFKVIREYVTVYEEEKRKAESR